MCSIIVFLSLTLQAIGEEIIQEAGNVADTVNFASPLSMEKGYLISLATLLILNVFVMVGNFIFDMIKHRKDNHNHKVHLIAKKGIEIESAIYDRFQKLSAFQPGDEHALLDGILGLDSYLRSNRLYIETQFFSIAIDFMDYFKTIQHTMTRKDIKKEESFFEKLSKAFYGE